MSCSLIWSMAMDQFKQMRCILSGARNNNKSGKTLLLGSASLSHNIRFNHSLETTGSRHHGRVHHLPIGLHYGNGVHYQSLKMGCRRTRTTDWSRVTTDTSLYNNTTCITALMTTVPWTKSLPEKLPQNITQVKMKLEPSKHRSISTVKGQVTDQRFHIHGKAVTPVSEMPVKSLG